MLWGLWAGLRWGAATSPASHQTLMSSRKLLLEESSQLADCKPLRLALGVEPPHALWLIAAGPNKEPPRLLLATACLDSSAVDNWISAKTGLLENGRF